VGRPFLELSLAKYLTILSQRERPSPLLFTTHPAYDREIFIGIPLTNGQNPILVAGSSRLLHTGLPALFPKNSSM
jgi:hypothetical protein